MRYDHASEVIAKIGCVDRAFPEKPPEPEIAISPLPGTIPFYRAYKRAGAFLLRLQGEARLCSIGQQLKAWKAPS